VKPKWNGILLVTIFFVTALSTAKLSAQKKNDEQLLHARETVWRTWFDGDTKALEELVPPETIVISSGVKEWHYQADVLRAAAKFHTKGGKLIRLEFPRTEVQHFGNVAVIYSQYLYEIDEDGKRSTTSGRVTEIFVRRGGRWTNPGWHTDEEK